MAAIGPRNAPTRLLLLALLCAVPTTPTARPVPKLAQPDYSLYHTQDRVFQAVRQTVAGCPATMRIDESEQVDGNYSSSLMVVTVEPGGLSESHADKIRLLLNFGEHGRELISSEIGLHLLRLLCDEAARRPLLDKFGLSPDTVQQLLQRAVFKVVPMENVRGRARVEAGELCERKNGRGVDPNRNWDLHWGFKERDYDPREEYPGLKPFSEPEAALMLGTASTLRPHVWASVHSGMEALFMPYDHKASIPEGEGPAATLSILKQINARTCRNKCAVGSGGKSVGYLAHGTATDYMFDRLQVPMPMTWEVYGDQHAAFEDCFKMFNPLTPEAYNATVESWTAAVFTLLTLLPQHPQIQAELHLPGGADAGAAAGTGMQGSAAGRAVAGDGAERDVSVAAALGQTAGPGNGTSREQQQQQEQRQEQQQGAASSGGEDNNSNSSADKALGIASALEEHVQLETELATSGQQQRDGGAGGAAALLGGGGIGSKEAAARRGHTLAVLYWLTVLVTGCCLASYLWSKPRVRYQLSKWLGSSRRRARGVIPV